MALPSGGSSERWQGGQKRNQGNYSPLPLLPDTTLAEAASPLWVHLLWDMCSPPVDPARILAPSDGRSPGI